MPIVKDIYSYVRRMLCAMFVFIVPELRAVKSIISQAVAEERSDLQCQCNAVFLQRLRYNPPALQMSFWENHFELIFAANCPQLSGRLLDFGCGSGHADIMLARLGRSVHGIDASPAGIAIAEHFKAKEPEGVRGRLSFACVDIMRDAPCNVLFEAVWASHVFEHISEPGPILQKLAGWVIAGAMLLISVPLGRAYDDPGHVHHFYSIEDLQQFLQPHIAVVSIEIDEARRVVRALCRFNGVRPTQAPGSSRSVPVNQEYSKSQ